jgi:hypothetical protein
MFNRCQTSLTRCISRPRHIRMTEKEKRLFGVGWMSLLHHLFDFTVTPEAELKAVLVVAALVTIVSVAFWAVINRVCHLLCTLTYLANPSPAEKAVWPQISGPWYVILDFLFH